ncbi:putative reverse transcriptase zinc-binding domain-containing protein [Helianthus annuus]|nr:putative reverse transcriptase zinc-binding domain-containing protein [Helianthus annuus]KAJ0617740.1 putative reverse transcriptase zinc-binding domain-containing protein [Helianthus annuus]KAJ0776279.1 putative reverse transcriptase zinc-binding domain-containing protein [Helianthus annuus]
MQVSYLLVNVSFTGSDDTWNWKTDTRQPFSVADVKTLIKEGTEQPSNYKMKWETWVPGKVNLFVWRTEMERIPTKIVLRSRNIDMPDVTCVLCDVEDEDVMHLFTGCGFSFGVWSAVANKRGKRTVKGIVMITCWAIWRARNAKVFQAKEPKVTEVVYSIKSWSYLWLKNRTRFCSILWKDWAINPLYML